MFNLRNILQFVIDRFNQGPFSEQNLVGYTHQGILHIVLDLGDKLCAVKEKVLEQCLPDISLVGTLFPLYVFQEPALFQRLAVIHISGSEHEIQDFAFVIAY